jgi:hypothetical protein
VPLAKERLLDAQRRYKENFDRAAGITSHRHCQDSWIFLKRGATNPEGSSKLDELADGHFRVIKSEAHTLVIRFGDDDVRVSASRVTRAPKPLAEIQPEGNSLDPTPRDMSDSTPNET